MFKIMALLKRKPGMAFEDFVEYYETRHAPLGIRLQTPTPFMSRYVRHYLRPLPYPLTGEVREPDYDVFTEIWFKDRETFDGRTKLLQRPDVVATLTEDESKFMDMTKRSMVVIEDRESKLPWVK